MFTVPNLFGAWHCSPSPSHLKTIGDAAQKLKKQCTSAEDEFNPDEDNSKAVSPKLAAQGWQGKYLKNPKGSRPVKPSTAGFFPPLWNKNKLFDLGKVQMWLYVALEEPVPWHEAAVHGQCSEVLFETLAHYQENNLEVEAGMIFFPLHSIYYILTMGLLKGYYPQYKLDMAKLVCH